MKTLYFNGNIYTGDGQYTHGLLVEDGIITHIGNDAAVNAGGAQAHDLEGKTVLPGLNDSHLHLYGVGKNLISVQLYGSDSIKQVISRGRAFIRDNQVPEGQVITGRGWNQDYFKDENRLLTRHDLDEISTTHPIIFRRACGHLLTCNSLALKLADITAATQTVSGGVIDKDEKGWPNGIFRELALAQVECLVPPHTEEQVKDALEKAMAYAASHGITSLQTNDINDRDYKLIDGAYTQLAREGKALCRVNMQSCFTDISIFKDYLADGYHMGQGDELYKIGPLKLFIDGSLGARTALMRAPYADDLATQGVSCMTQQQLEDFVALATEQKMQVIIHAIGDKAIEMALDAFDNCGGNGNPLRHGIVHAQITDFDLVKRFEKQHILAFVQPIFLHYDMHIVENRVGVALAHTSYAFGTMNKIGVHTSFGTDSPVEDLNTMENLHCAVNRQDLKSQPLNGYVPKERFSIEEAIKCYTAEGAFASFEEDKKGQLIPGQFADFIILDRNIFKSIDKILDVQVLTTVMNGKITYHK